MHPLQDAVRVGHHRATARPAVVLSVAKLAPEHATYYERSVARGRDDYYAGRGEAPGRWIGTGAEALALSGELADGDLSRLLRLEGPEGGARLRKLYPERV